MLEEETKKMEEKLEMVKKMMELEKEKRNSQQAKKSKDGTVWRSATTQKQINGYSQMVLSQHKQNQPNLPPTNLIMGKENQTKANLNQSRLGSNQSTRVSGGTGNQMTVSGNAAADNLNKALNRQNPGLQQQKQTVAASESQQDYPEVEQFLSEIQLQKYRQPFLDNGIEDLEIILELDEKHLEQMSIPLGHKLKIMKRIKDLRRDRGMTVPESRQGGQRPRIDDSNAQVNNVNKEVKPHQKQDLEALPEPDYSQLHSSKTGATNTAGNGDSLLTGKYNEQESHQQFLEALNAWRNAGTTSKPNNSQQQDKKSVRFNENANTTQSVSGNGSLQQEKDIKTDMQIRTDSAASSRKESCWNCYKLFPAIQAIADHATKRSFCSELCFEKNMQANSIKCQFPECSNRFVKVVGTLVHGKWFCSQKCANLDPDTKQMQELYEKGIEFNNDQNADEDEENYANDEDIDL
eukprot:403345183